MKKSFEKKYKAIFGIEQADKKEANFKPLDRNFVQIVNLIHKDRFELDIRDPQNSNISKIATFVRSIYDYDTGAFQMFAYIFEAFMWQ